MNGSGEVSKEPFNLSAHFKRTKALMVDLKRRANAAQKQIANHSCRKDYFRCLYGDCSGIDQRSLLSVTQLMDLGVPIDNRCAEVFPTNGTSLAVFSCV
jgi:hypothetical protein